MDSMPNKCGRSIARGCSGTGEEEEVGTPRVVDHEKGCHQMSLTVAQPCGKAMRMGDSGSGHTGNKVGCKEATLPLRAEIRGMEGGKVGRGDGGIERISTANAVEIATAQSGSTRHQFG